LPALRCGVTDAALPNESCTSPVNTPMMAAPAPLYGTCVIRVAVINLNSSAARCGEAPIPLVE
jgi:hypothetical protein